jgi:hypothetical protein
MGRPYERSRVTTEAEMMALKALALLAGTLVRAIF